MIDLQGYITRFTLKMNIFPSIFLETGKVDVGTVRTGLVLTDMIDLRGHIPRFSLKMNIFPSICLDFGTVRTGLIFLRQLI